MFFFCSEKGKGEMRKGAPCKGGRRLCTCDCVCVFKLWAKKGSNVVEKRKEKINETKRRGQFQTQTVVVSFGWGTITRKKKATKNKKTVLHFFNLPYFLDDFTPFVIPSGGEKTHEERGRRRFTFLRISLHCWGSTQKRRLC